MELGELPTNHFAEFKINSSLFTPVIPKEAEQEVFIEDKEKKQYEQLENGKWKKHLEVVEHTKSDAGHRDVKTFITHYCHSRYSDEQKRNELEKTLNV